VPQRQDFELQDGVRARTASRRRQKCEEDGHDCDQE
jgi:hypothetical protein